MIFVFIFLFLFLVLFLWRKFKIPKISAVAMFTGGVKSGKSTCSVYFALSKYKSQCRKVRTANFFRKIFRKDLLEMPLLYSNVPLKCKYVPVTDDLLLRRTRFVYRSVIYIQEASLVADSQLCKNMTINEQLLLFNKLIGHETKGGYLIYDTQTISDNHYSVKRCLSEYFYVHDMIRWIPFVLLAHVRELRYSEDNNEINVYDEDIEDSLKTIIIPKKIWKKFDAYCYSVLTDNLPVENEIQDNRFEKDLKAKNIVSFRKYKDGGVAHADRKKF